MKVFSGRIDLHCHSTASDGVLPPSALIQRAYHQGVGLLALTDHDTIAGVEQAEKMAQAFGIQFIAGVEISTYWANQSIHVVGLQMDRTNAEVVGWIEQAWQARRNRAIMIAERLEELGFAGAVAWVCHEIEQNNACPSRANFGRWLLQQSYVKNYQEAFDRWLGVGKPAHVGTERVEMVDAVRWIGQVGGVAVLAHPGRYKLGEEWMRRELIKTFARAGGQAIEITSGSHSSDWTGFFRTVAQRYRLFGSTGSDWHSPTGVRPSLGHQGLWNRSLAITPVWELLGYQCQDESIMAITK